MGRRTLPHPLGISDNSRTSTGESPYNLAFGSEVVIPVEVGLPTIRIQHYEEPSNSDRRKADLDFLLEVRMAAYQQKVARYYDRSVKRKIFQPGDLVLRKAEVSKPTEQGKLSPNWEGPYRVTEALRPGAYKLEYLEGTIVPRTWNADNLKMYYQ